LATKCQWFVCARCIHSVVFSGNQHGQFFLIARWQNWIWNLYMSMCD
jgi:hypothetical protein